MDCKKVHIVKLRIQNPLSTNTALRINPSNFSIPFIVCVFPDPDYPYANTQPFYKIKKKHKEDGIIRASDRYMVNRLAKKIKDKTFQIKHRFQEKEKFVAIKNDAQEIT